MNISTWVYHEHLNPKESKTYLSKSYSPLNNLFRNGNAIYQGSQAKDPGSSFLSSFFSLPLMLNWSQSLDNSNFLSSLFPLSNFKVDYFYAPWSIWSITARYRRDSQLFPHLLFAPFGLTPAPKPLLTSFLPL